MIECELKSTWSVSMQGSSQIAILSFPTRRCAVLFFCYIAPPVKQWHNFFFSSRSHPLRRMLPSVYAIFLHFPFNHFVSVSLFISSYQRLGSLPLGRFSHLGLHSTIALHQESCLQDTWPAHFHFNFAIRLLTSLTLRCSLSHLVFFNISA